MSEINLLSNDAKNYLLELYKLHRATLLNNENAEVLGKADKRLEELRHNYENLSQKEQKEEDKIYKAELKRIGSVIRQTNKRQRECTNILHVNKNFLEETFKKGMKYNPLYENQLEQLLVEGYTKNFDEGTMITAKGISLVEDILKQKNINKKELIFRVVYGIGVLISITISIIALFV